MLGAVHVHGKKHSTSSEVCGQERQTMGYLPLFIRPILIEYL